MKRNLTVKILLASAILLNYSNLRCEEQENMTANENLVAEEVVQNDISTEELSSSLEKMKSCDAKTIEIAFEVTRGENYDPELWERVLEQLREFSIEAGLPAKNKDLTQQVIVGVLTEGTKIIIASLLTQLYQIVINNITTRGNLKISVLGSDQTPEEIVASEDKASVIIRYNRDDYDFDVWDSMFDNLREKISQNDEFESGEEGIELIKNILENIDPSALGKLFVIC